MELKPDENGICMIGGRPWRLMPLDITEQQANALLTMAQGNKEKAWDYLMGYVTVVKHFPLPYSNRKA